MRLCLRPILISSLTMTLKHSNGLTLGMSKSVNAHITLLYLTKSTKHPSSLEPP